MVLCSSQTGQAALQTLPSSLDQAVVGGGGQCTFAIAHYPLPKNGLMQQQPSDNSDTASVVSSTSRKSNLGSPRRSQRSLNFTDGIAVYKINKNGKLQARRLAFSVDRRNLVVTTTRIKSLKGFFKAATGAANNETKTIHLSRVDRVQSGFHTPRFWSSMTTTSNPPELVHQVLLPEKALSIVYESEGGKWESLDLVVPDPDDYENMVSTLRGLVRLHQEERNSKTRELQILQHYWLEMDKPLVETSQPTSNHHNNNSNNQNNHNQEGGGLLSLNEFLHLADQLNFYESIGKAKLSALFKQKCERLRRSTEKLTFTETAALVEKARQLQNLVQDDPLEALWNQMVATDPIPAVTVDDDASYDSYELNVMSEQDEDGEESISTVAFLSFLRSEQKEFIKTLEEATELVNTLNCLQTTLHPGSSSSRFEREQSRVSKKSSSSSKNVTTIAPDDRLTKSQFMDFMVSDFNDLCHTQPVPTMDMTRPLSHYFIATSHASFLALPTHLPGALAWNASHVTFSDQAQAESIYTALYRGVRCLETLVWDGPNQMEPMVSLTEGDLSKSIRFQSCLDAIAYFLDCQPMAFPILLKIENHCSTRVQSVLAQQIRQTLGLSGRLYEPVAGLHDTKFQLPSPEQARGKVIVMGKRPRDNSKQQPGTCDRIMNDDYDATNDEWDLVATPSQIKYFDDEEELGENKGVVVGFNASGPIYSMDIHSVANTPQAMWVQAEQEKTATEREAKKARDHATQLQDRAERREVEALEMSQQAGISAEEFREAIDSNPSLQEEKSMKDDEGVEIHEVLSSIVETNNQEYAKAAHEAMDSAKRANYHKKAYQQAEERLQQARQELDQAKNYVNRLVQESQKSRLQATANYEHADIARARLEQVKDLLKNSEETSTSAETVVVTALTEAKISEKRAADAETRASRAFATAAKDRGRSDGETRKEEELEQKVTALLGECKDASRGVKAAREEVEKTSSSLERVTDQIRLIENSSNYKRELQRGTSPRDSDSPPRHGGSVVDKHKAKVREKDLLTRRLREASNQLKNAEEDKIRLQKEFEDSNQVLRLQTELASKMRKVADRSAHVAEELAEHAEEEREAANLRHVARERAEANVQNRGTHKESLQTQFQEAQRAAEEATQMAEDSRKRADHLEKELAGAQDFNRLLQIVEEREWGRNEAKVCYDQAVQERDAKDAVLMKQKDIVKVSDEVRYNTRQNMADEEDRQKNKKYFHQGAVLAYDEAALLRQEAQKAKNYAEEAESVFREKRRIARRALEYKNRMSLVVEIPPNLSAQTLMHSLRFYHWSKSMELSQAHYHSLAWNVLQKMMDTQPDYHVRNIRAFTERHMCRVYPSNKNSNYDPIFPWSLGAQLCSMNYNNPDEHLLVAEGMFRRNGSCGYVLKPPSLFGPRKEYEIQRWTIKILGASHLPKLADPKRRHHTSTIMPTVGLTVHTGETGALPFTFETRHSHRTGTDPVFYSEDNVCTFDVRNKWIAMASFIVWDKSLGGEKNNFIAGAAIPISCLKEGYRSLALYDTHNSRAGPYKFASLLVHVSKDHSY